MTKNINSWLPVILWMALIFFFSSRPDLPSNQIYVLDFIIKKSAHIFEFTVLCLLINRARKYQDQTSSFLLSLSYAFTDEIHQLFVPGRTGQLLDVFIDSLGISLAIWLIIHSLKWKSLKLTRQ